MLSVMDWIRKRSPAGRTASKLYGSIVSQAREPVFYTSYGVPDTVEGRYEMIALHVCLVLEGIERGATSDAVARALIEHFVTDMDDSLRQLAVGDLSVPRKVKKAAAGLRERHAAYRSALGGDEPVAAMTSALATAMGEALPENGIDHERLARYAVANHQHLEIGHGAEVAWLPPAETSTAGHDASQAEIAQ